MQGSPPEIKIQTYAFHNILHEMDSKSNTLENTLFKLSNTNKTLLTAYLIILKFRYNKLQVLRLLSKYYCSNKYLGAQHFAFGVAISSLTISRSRYIIHRAIK